MDSSKPSKLNATVPQNAKRYIQRQYARLRTNLDIARYNWQTVTAKHPRIISITFVLLLILASIFALNIWLDETGTTITYRLNETAAIYVSGGSALFGATAIISSIVLFSVQINIERAPYSLFRKLSSDSLLILLFGYSFTMPALIVTASAFLTQENAPWLNLGSAWGVLTTLITLQWCYRRALRLISPIQQINMELKQAEESCRSWNNAAERSRPLIEHLTSTLSDPDDQFDRIKSFYWEKHPHWTNELRDALHNFAALSQTYAINGDQQIAGTAVTSIPRLLKAYVTTRRGTFISEHPFFAAGNGTDAFINDVLEEIRKLFEQALSRGDERHIDFCVTAMSLSAQILTQIDYRSPYARKAHASIAMLHLTGAMERVVEKKMPDSSLHAIREIGRASRRMLEAAPQIEALGAMEKLALKALPPGIANTAMLPASIEAVAKFAEASVLMIASPHNKLRHTSKRVHELICLVAEVTFKFSDNVISKNHSAIYAPYFGYQTDSMIAKLIHAANIACERPEQDAESIGFIGNFEDWLDGVGRNYHDLYTASLQSESSLSLDLVQWMASVSDIASALATAPAASTHVREQLLTHARKFLPGLASQSYETTLLNASSNTRLSTAIAELGIKAANRDQNELATEILRTMIGWTKVHVISGSRYPDDLLRNAARIAALTATISDSWAEPIALIGVKQIAQSAKEQGIDLREIAEALLERAADPSESFLLTEIELRSVDDDLYRSLVTKVSNIFDEVAA